MGVFKISQQTAKKYINMTKEEIDNLDNPNNYKKRNSTMNVYLNIIYKMMADGCSNETIYFYIKRQKDFHDSDRKLANYIYILGKNNFPDRHPFNAKTTMELILPPDVTVINRTDLLKYVLTCNPKTKRDTTIEKYIEQLKEKYPVIGKVEAMFKEFHGIIMGTDETKLDEYLEKYTESKIQSFCNGIKKDITPVKNAISLSISSGFVEGNNNKFKVLKRIVYGRSGLVNLEKKCKLAFLSKEHDFFQLGYFVLLANHLKHTINAVFRLLSFCYQIRSFRSRNPVFMRVAGFPNLLELDFVMAFL